MARDFATKPNRRRQAQGRGRRKAVRATVPGWAWALAGLAVGLFVAALVYLNDHHPHQLARANAVPAHAAVSAKRSAGVGAGHGAAATKQKPHRPRFDFYTILPEQEVVVPEGAPDDARSGPASDSKPAVYLLQAGSFRTIDQADSMRARLALLGVEATIETVKLSDTDTWHRVRIGPFHGYREADRVQQKLQGHDINTLLVKIKG